MALSIEKRYWVDLDTRLNVHYGGGLLFTGDAGADTFEVTLYKSGEAYAPGGSVALNCIRADGNTVTVTGSISGNVASATLTQACCAIPGPLSVVMQIISGGNTGAVFAAAYTVMPAQTGEPIDPGTTITDIAALIAQIDAAVDSIPADYSGLLAAIAPTFSTSTAYVAGDYVWYDGDLYKFTAAHSAGAWTGSDVAVAVFATDIADLKSDVDDINNDILSDQTISYLNDSSLLTSAYVDSSGVEHSHVAWRVTDYISLEAIKKIYAHVGAYTAYPLAVYYDEDKDVIGYESVSTNYQYNYTDLYLTIPASAAYCRVNMWLNKTDGSHDNQYITSTVSNIAVLEETKLDKSDFTVDTTLTVPGQPADAKTVGDKFAEVDTALEGKVDYSGVVATSGDVVGMIGSTGQYQPQSTSWHCIYTDIIDCAPGYIYHYTGRMKLYTEVAYFFLNGVFVSSYGNSQNLEVRDENITIPSGANQVRFCAMHQTNGQISMTVSRVNPLPYNDLLTEFESIDMDTVDARLDLVTEYRQEPQEPIAGTTGQQLIDPSTITWVLVSGTSFRGYSGKIRLCGNGAYYPNPANISSSSGGQTGWRYVYFYDAYGEVITFDGAIQNIGELFSTNPNCWFEIEDGRVFKYYIANRLARILIGDGDIVYVGSESTDMWRLDGTKVEAGQSVGLTYMTASETYTSYTGSGTEPEMAYTYSIDMMRFTADWLEAHPNYNSDIYNYTYPASATAEFVSVMKYYQDRARRKDENVIRVANFNQYIGNTNKNWRVISDMLAEYGIDICGFEETPFVTSGNVTYRIEDAMKAWQFTSGSNSIQTSTGKALVSHWTVTSAETVTLWTNDSSTVQYCIKCKINLYPYMRYSGGIDNVPTLTVYVYHGASSAQTIGGTSYTSGEVRLMEIDAILADVANDTSDFVIVTSDTNCFEELQDLTAGTYGEWERFRAGGLTPVLPGYESTVTAETSTAYIFRASNGKYYSRCPYDQIFVSSKITPVGYTVIDSNLYAVPELGGAPVSDHCMIYADLKFDFEAVMQERMAAALE